MRPDAEIHLHLDASGLLIVCTQTNADARTRMQTHAHGRRHIYRSSKLCQKARDTGIPLIHNIFTEVPRLSYTTFGFNASDCNVYWRTYTDADKMCSNFIRDVKLFPQVNRGLSDEVYYMCTC